MVQQQDLLKNNKDNEPYIKNLITIREFSNGNVTVEGFPMNVGDALEIMLLGIKAITDFFINAAMDGKLKRGSNIIAPSVNDIAKLN